MDITHEKTKKEILAFSFDSIDLCSFSCIINGSYNCENLDLLKNATFEFIKYMLEKDFLKAGDLLLDDTIGPWNLPIDEIIEEIKFRWNSLDRKLSMYELVWFEITEKGRKEFEYLDSLTELKEPDSFYLNDK